MAAFTEEQMKEFSIKNWYDLSGQVAVVTGGATGLGLAITRCLVSAGAKVAIVASRAPELVADTLAEFGGKAVFENLVGEEDTEKIIKGDGETIARSLSGI